MKITKYLHSCLLIEDQGKTILIDPGIFTDQNKALNGTMFSQLDFILITHAHPDHMSLSLIKELISKFPKVNIISNHDTVAQLTKEGVPATTSGTEFIKLVDSNHEKVWDHNPPQNTVVTVFDRLSHPGDSLSFKSTADTLALPIQALWGSTTWAVETAIKLKPKFIVPIHDYMWRDEFRRVIYTRLADFFIKNNIQFKGLETGETVEL